MVTKHRTKLWGKIARIVAVKTTKFSQKKYQVKLVGVDKLLWVYAHELSKGVVDSFKSGTLCKNAKALVDRGYVLEQRKFYKNQEARAYK